MTSEVDASIQIDRCRDGKWDFHVWLGEEYLGVGWRSSAEEALAAAKKRLDMIDVDIVLKSAKPTP